MKFDRITLALGIAFAGMLIWSWTSALAQAPMVGSVKLTEVSWAGTQRLVAIILLASICAVFSTAGRWKSIALVSGGIAAGILFSVLYAGYQWHGETLAGLEMMGVDTGPGGNFQIEWRAGAVVLAAAALILLVMLCRFLYTLSKRQVSTEPAS